MTQNPLPPAHPPATVSRVQALVKGAIAHPKALLAGVGTAVALIGLGLSNPSQPEYVNYAAEKFPQELKQQCEELNKSGRDKVDLGGILSLSGSGLCRSLVGSADFVGRGLVKQVIQSSTQRQNYLVASHYTTAVMGRTIKTIGIGNQFITYYSR
jgi:hypothetical protein